MASVVNYIVSEKSVHFSILITFFEWLCEHWVVIQEPNSEAIYDSGASVDDLADEWSGSRLVD